jgi:hypothetical protein
MRVNYDGIAIALGYWQADQERMKDRVNLELVRSGKEAQATLSLSTESSYRVSWKPGMYFV